MSFFDMLSFVTAIVYSDYNDIDASKLHIREGKELLSRLKDFSSALRSIQACVECSRYKITDALNPLVLHDGIKSLPDDILASIFEKVVDLTSQQTRNTLTLASVNRRFRHIALRLPGLWSTLSYLRRTRLKLFLERSAEVGLTVFLGSATPQWYMKEILPHSYRWRNVIICDPKISTNSVLKLTDDEQEIVCPNVQTISVDLLHNRHSSISLGSSFIFPALQHLKISNIMPSLSQDVSASLMSFELQFKASERVSQDLIATFPLLRQLSFMRNLRELSLSFKSIELDIEPDSPDCYLPHLRRFNIELSGETDDDCLMSFLDKLIMTNVQNVFVKLTVEEETHSWISTIFHPTHRLLENLEPRFPSLEDVVIIVEPLYRNRNKLFLFMDNLLGFPHMKTLYIHAPDIYMYFLDPRKMDTRTLRLRTLTIKGCKFGVHKFLDQLLMHVNPDGTQFCRNLEKLEIIGCPEISKNYLLDHLPVEKIGWSPAVDGNYEP